MTEVAYIMQGHSHFDDRLWAVAALLPYVSEEREFESLDYFDLLPYFVWAGASIETDAENPDLHHCRVIVPDGHEEAFYSALETLAAQR